MNARSMSSVSLYSVFEGVLPVTSLICPQGQRQRRVAAYIFHVNIDVRMCQQLLHYTAVPVPYRQVQRRLFESVVLGVHVDSCRSPFACHQCSFVIASFPSILRSRSSSSHMVCVFFYVCFERV